MVLSPNPFLSVFLLPPVFGVMTAKLLFRKTPGTSFCLDFFLSFRRPVIKRESVATARKHLSARPWCGRETERCTVRFKRTDGLFSVDAEINALCKENHIPTHQSKCCIRGSWFPKKLGCLLFPVFPFPALSFTPRTGFRAPI